MAKIKYMSEKMLLKLITNNYMGDPSDGYGHDYHDQKDEIDQRYWELRDQKISERFELKIKQLEKIK